MKIQTKRKPSKRAAGNRAKGAKKNDGQSLKDKYGKFNGDLSYPDSIEELEDSAVREMMLPKAQIPVGKPSKKMTCDSATSGLVSEYSGPIPLGFRTIPSSSFMSFKGPMGKAVKHFGARNFYLGDQVNAWFDQNCFVNKADSMPGEDAVAAGVNVVWHGDMWISPKYLDNVLELARANRFKSIYGFEPILMFDAFYRRDNPGAELVMLPSDVKAKKFEECMSYSSAYGYFSTADRAWMNGELIKWFKKNYPEKSRWEK